MMLGLPFPGFCFLFLLFSLASCSPTGDGTVVNTKSGPVKGKLLSESSSSVMAYLGIPYAEPPLGNLRFQKPRPHQPWRQVLEAYNFGNACSQFTYLEFPDSKMWALNRPMSEDCLFLNIWVPHPRPSTPTPILVWIHGGSGFSSGSASLDLYNGASLAAREKVIVASINYRLGALGFLSLPPAIPGNMGLLDQQLALTWVKENAAAFGGDPSKITIFGHNGGAVSVGLHLLSPRSQPLFSQAILQSAVPNVLWGWKSPEEVKQKTLALSQLLGCGEIDENAVLSCLREKNATEFGQQELPMMEKSEFLLDLPFLPTTDGDFLPEDPQKLLQSGHIQVKPILLGATSDEASAFVLYYYPHVKDGLISWNQLLKVAKMTIRNANAEDVKAVALKYSEDYEGAAQYRSAMNQMISEYGFWCPLAEFAATVQKAGSPVYAYTFSHHTSGSFFPEWLGAPHGAELPYIFGSLEVAVAVNKTYTEAEAALSHRIMHYWAEFARNGNPTGSNAKVGEWPLYNATQKKVFLLNTEVPQNPQVSPALHCDFLKAYSAQSNESNEGSLSPSEDGKEPQ
uniref:Carboxylesterase type B domain-containing protein n=1 Tax=Anolis carolinensis TaxID=28377 RepID=R4GAB8_ANOCA|nr:PREDICTED: acetylcholinesterase [Anolis carolinensis]|eukprot:XP_003217974.2 PREDICTED: acetylcholinesterase [Anolis carolinensis]